MSNNKVNPPILYIGPPSVSCRRALPPVSCRLLARHWLFRSAIIAPGRVNCFTASFFPAYDYVTGRKAASRRTGVILAFGDHRLDIERRELRRDGRLVQLEPRAFDLLTFLVLH